MANEVPVFIISHERAETITTYDLLKKSGFTGKIYVVVDDMDTQIDKYKQKFKESLLIFSKEDVMKRCDPVDNFKIYTSALYPRLYCWEKAKELGYDIFVVCDDDITGFNIRYVKGEKLSHKKVNDMDKIIELLDKFMRKTHIAAIGPFFANGLFGGKNGIFREGLVPSPFQFKMINTSCDGVEKWRGTRNEDGIFCADNWSIGNPDFAITNFVFNSKERGEGSGGLNEDYIAITKWILDSYLYITHPGGYTLNDGGITKVTNNLYPKILPEKWRKKSCR